MLVPEIRQLSPSVINKIAAGEVIERPASVVKELLENAVDAGSTRIDVTIEQGGLELVRISDNGCGIAADQLPLAVASHATSKIRDADDLFHVSTLGFRGEALASIAEVSRLRLRSRRPEDASAAELEVVGGLLSDTVPCAGPVGTLIEIRQLFYNTPVRRKFLRSPQTELGHSTEAFLRIAIAHPEVHFTLRHGERLLHDLPPVDDLRERIAALLGRDLADGLISVSSSDGPIRLSGFVAHPDHTRSHNRLQYVFLNGRHIRDKALGHALGEAYRGLVMVGRYPITFLRLDLPPEMVDVNVHPTKMEVRFQDGGRLYSQLLGTLRTRFLTSDLSTAVRPAGQGTDLGATPAGAMSERPAHDPNEAERMRSDLVRWAQGELQGEKSRSESSAATAVADAPELPYPAAQPRLGLTRFDPTQFPGASRPWPAREAAIDAPPMVQPVENAPAGNPAPAFPYRHQGLQIHNRYLVTESAEGVVVIDQHALHERILYEQLRERIHSKRLEAQKLLVPEPVTLAPAEAAAALEAKDLLAELGIEVQPFGGDTILVCSYPAMLANFGPAEILRQTVERLLAAGKPDHRELLDELLHMIACKAAIKAGDRLTPEEVATLLDQRHVVQDAHHCPHGRPTALTFTREELDRRFKRT